MLTQQFKQPSVHPLPRRYQMDVEMFDTSPQVFHATRCYDLSPSPPPAPNYGQITRDTLQAQVDLAPQQFAVEQQYQPQYSALELQNLNTLLNGTPGGVANYNASTKAGQSGWYDASGQFLSPGTLAGAGVVGSDWSHGGGSANSRDGKSGPAQPYYVAGAAPQPGAVWRNAGDVFDVSRPRSTDAMPGLFELTRQQNTAQRRADIGDMSVLGPQALAAMRAYNPRVTGLLDQMDSQASDLVSRNGALDPFMQRALQQNYRTGESARGFGGGTTDAAMEAYYQAATQEQRRLQNIQLAGGVAGQEASYYGDPFMQILGRSSGALPGAFQGQQQSGPALFNPQAGLDLAASNYSAQTQFAAAQNPLGAIGGILGGVGGMFGGIGKMFGK